MILDAETHLLHPAARRPDFAAGSAEPARKALHEHPDFEAIAPLASREGLLDSMARAGIKRAVVMGLPWLDPEIQAENNAYIAESVASAPSVFRGLYIPNLADPGRAAREIAALDTRIFAGVKLIPGWQGVRLCSPRLAPVIQAVRARNLPLMVHVGHVHQDSDPDTPQRLYRFLRHNRDITVVAAHLGGLLGLYRRLPAVENVLARTHFVTSVSSTMYLAGLCAAVHPESLLFGTDFPFNHCHDQITPLEEMKRLMHLPAEQQEAILWSNAAKLFGFS